MSKVLLASALLALLALHAVADNRLSTAELNSLNPPRRLNDGPRPQPNIANGDDASSQVDDRTPRLVQCFSDGCRSCTAAVIRRGWLLTAAHCFVNNGFIPGSVRVVYKGENYYAKTIHIRNDYSTSTSFNDLTLVRIHGALDLPFEGASGRDMVFKLPTRESHTPAAGSTLRIAGFGRIEGNAMPEVLQESTVTTVPDAQCVNGPIDLANDGGMMCSNEPDGNGVSCPGDSGGPLFVDAGTGFRLIGITSGGLGFDGVCGNPVSLSFFAEVRNYLDDILACVKGDCSAWFSARL